MAVEFKFNDTIVDKLDWLMDATNSESREEVLMKSVVLLERITDTIVDGGTVILTSKDGETTFISCE